MCEPDRSGPDPGSERPCPQPLHQNNTRSGAGGDVLCRRAEFVDVRQVRVRDAPAAGRVMPRPVIGEAHDRVLIPQLAHAGKNLRDVVPPDDGLVVRCGGHFTCVLRFVIVSDNSTYRRNQHVETSFTESAVTPIEAWKALCATPDIVARLQRWSAQASGAYSRNTERACWSDWRDFAQWCRVQGVPMLPATPETVAEFLHSHVQGVAVSSIKRRAAALAFLHRKAQLPDPCDSGAVRDALRAISCERGTDRRQAKGLSQRDADKIAGWCAARKTKLRDLRDLAVVLVGRDLLARASELVALTVKAITWQEKGTALVRLRRVKTSTETTTHHLGADAAGALQRWLEAASVASGPAFRSITKGGRVKDKAISTRDYLRAHLRVDVDWQNSDEYYHTLEWPLDGNDQVKVTVMTGSYARLTVDEVVDLAIEEERGP